jgi:pseudouridine synthase
MLSTSSVLARQERLEHYPSSNNVSVRWISGTKAARKKQTKKRLEMQKKGQDPREMRKKKNAEKFGVITVDDVTHMYAQEKVESAPGSGDDTTISLRKLTENDILEQKAQAALLKQEAQTSGKGKIFSRKYRGQRQKQSKAPLVRVDRVLASRGLGTRSEMQSFCKFKRVAIFTTPPFANGEGQGQEEEHLRHNELYERVQRLEPWFNNQQDETEENHFDDAAASPTEENEDQTELPPYTIVSGPSERVPDDSILLLDKVHVVPPLPVAFAYHKPKGVLSSMTPEKCNRPFLAQMLPKQLASASSVHHVGRLDCDTSGLILFSTRGDITQRLLHPKHAVSKEYVATVEGVVDKSKLQHQLEVTGVVTSEGTHKAELLDVEILPAQTKPAQESENSDDEVTITTITTSSIVRLVVSEGKHRMVRRMLANCGHPVLELRRERHGECLLEDLPVGHFRSLSDDEVEWLTSLV